ncbi:MAG: DUF4129 domain-containing protein [Acidimicrobiales bacterium]
MASEGAPAGESVSTRVRERAERALAALLDRRRLAAIGVLLVWVVVIAWSSGAAPTDRSWLGMPDLGDIITVIVLTGSLLGLILFIALLASGRRSDSELPARKPMWPSIIVMLLLFLVLTRLPRSEEDDRTSEPPEPAADFDVPVSLPTGVIGRNEFVGLAILILVSACAMIWTRRRMALVSGPEAVADSLDDRLEPILAEAVDSLQHGSDPRAAVLAAYAALESAFADLGWQRGRSETPGEFVGRVLARFPAAAGPVAELAELYEIARFSNRSVTTADQRRAMASLGAAQARLAADRTVARSAADMLSPGQPGPSGTS